MITPTMLLYAASTIATTTIIVILIYDLCINSKLQFEKHRKCYCGVIFQEGYLDERDGKTYCSEQCARDDMTQLEYQRGIRNEQLFWTSFYE